MIVKGELTGWSLRLVYWIVGFFKGLASCIGVDGNLWLWCCKGLKLPFFPHQISLWTSLKISKVVWGNFEVYLLVKKWLGIWLWIGWRII